MGMDNYGIMRHGQTTSLGRLSIQGICDQQRGFHTTIMVRASYRPQPYLEKPPPSRTPLLYLKRISTMVAEAGNDHRSGRQTNDCFTLLRPR